jgi:peptidase E
MEVHLFSATDAGDELDWAAKVSRELLAAKSDAAIACLPLGMLSAGRWLAEARRAFKDLGELRSIDTETMDLPQMEGVLRGAALAYLPAGNTFLFNHRLHLGRLVPYLRQKIRNGLPVLAVGAGAELCGPNILTSSDMNVVATPTFDALGISPFNFHAGYEDNPLRDDWLSGYHTFHDGPIIMLEEAGYVKITGKKTMLVRGRAWCWRAGGEKERLEQNEPVSPH